MLGYMKFLNDRLRKTNITTYINKTFLKWWLLNYNFYFYYVFSAFDFFCLLVKCEYSSSAHFSISNHEKVHIYNTLAQIPFVVKLLQPLKKNPDGC